MEKSKVRLHFNETVSTIDECFRRGHEYDLDPERAEEFRNVAEVIETAPAETAKKGSKAK